ncbi:kinase-like domain-containing protein [Parasitella parasitica]|nr:kinase-like domain-containing protein [Parasitella parasitica]
MSSSHTFVDKKIEQVGDYLIKNRIGQGSFAVVYKAQHKDTRQNVAIKCVKRSKLTKKLLENLESEISILTRIRHDNIVGLIECQKTEAHIYLVMEYCTMGDLSHYIKEIRSDKSIKNTAGGLPERVVRHFLKQLANALQFLRSQNLIHRDIKPQNLLLTPSNTHSDDLPVLKVADFGFARFLPNASLADTLCGSPLYMGPEILSYKKYDAKADLWSVGAVLYEMVTGRPPFRAQNHIELLKKIQENNDKIQFPDERHSDIVIGSDLKDLIRKLLKKNPVERSSFEEFFNHPAVLLQQPQPQPIQRRASVQPQRSSSKQTQSQSDPSQHHHHKTGSYEPPPFAQISSSKPDQRRWSSTTVRNTGPDAISPLYSQGRRPSKFESKDQQPWTPSSPFQPSSLMNSGTKPQNSKKEEEEMLQEYVMLDLRSIETNQFADELKVTPPRSTPLNERRLSKSPSSAATSHAVNIPTATSGTSANVSPSSSPFIRERKSSTGSSAGSALAKAISKASVRLFGTSMPSPPKEPHHLVGSPHGFMSSSHDQRHHQRHHKTNHTIKRIESMACMAHAVAKYGDQKYELLQNGSSGDMKLLSEETSALFLKALALIEVGLSVAQQYWSSDLIDVEEEEERKIAASRLYDAVQWMREKFNESLERAESVDTDMSASTNLNNSAFVDKLLYDRALEMSRAAAVHELVGENITECEQDYQTAIWMLEAIYQVRPKGEMTIDENDRLIINKFISSIRHRITVLRKKMVAERV